jgi:hypothetical protein
MNDILEKIAQIVRDNNLRKDPCGCIHFEGVMTCQAHRDKPTEEEIQKAKRQAEGFIEEIG